MPDAMALLFCQMYDDDKELSQPHHLYLRINPYQVFPGDTQLNYIYAQSLASNNIYYLGRLFLFIYYALNWFV